MINSQLHADAQEKLLSALTQEQLLILDDEHNMHIAGQTKSYTWEEAKEIVRGKNSMR